MLHPILNEIEKASIELMLTEPFYGHFLSNLVKEISTRSPNLSLGLNPDGRLRLIINPDYWEKQLKDKKNLQVGALKHELLHLIFRHWKQRGHFNNKILFDLAADVCVNQYLASNQTLEANPKIEDFKEFQLQKQIAVFEYYETFREAWQTINQILKDYLQGQAEIQSAGPAPKENQTPETASKDYEENDFLQYLNPAQKKLWQYMKNAQKQASPHQTWENFEKISNSEQQVLEQEIEQAARNAAQRSRNSQQYGRLPGQILSYLDQILNKENEINWRRMLRLFVANKGKTYLKSTLKRQSKRYGTSPGQRIAQRHRVLVALDTSGSISTVELQAFFSEIHNLWRNGTTVEIIEADAEIQASYPFRGQIPKEIKGRGGTSFDPALAYANQHNPPDVLVYFTDGFGSCPESPIRYPLLWLITNNGAELEDLKDFPGMKVKMNRI